MTKTAIYNKVSNEVLELIVTTKLTKSQREELMNIIDQNLKPKVGGSSSRPADIDGKTYCRYTGEYYDYDEMVYQNQAARDAKKHKGYSKEGIARWTKARAKLAKWEKELGSLGVKAMDGSVTDEDKKRFAELKKLIDGFDGNNFEYLKSFA